MEIIGFFALLLFGGWLVIGGLGGGLAAYGFSGKIPTILILIAMIGLAVVAAALYYAPFAIVRT
jgi:hypothetical protein